MSSKKPGWRTLARAAIITKPGTAKEFHTGDWRTKRPKLDESKCVNCLFCWIWCPEPAINRGPTKVSIDYDYCKGCGICVVECPAHALTMEEEH